MKNLYEDTYLLDPVIRDTIKQQFIQINEAVIDFLKDASTVNGIIDEEQKKIIEDMKFVDVYETNFDDDHDSMIIVVEPESGGPEFIMFDPNQDKLPELINS